jgi:hypothetical protein
MFVNRNSIVRIRDNRSKHVTVERDPERKHRRRTRGRERRAAPAEPHGGRFRHRGVPRRDRTGRVRREAPNNFMPQKDAAAATDMS